MTLAWCAKHKCYHDNVVPIRPFQYIEEKEIEK
jgi:hypothetical protein